MSILSTIGNTPLIPLLRLAPTSGAIVLLKLESLNPSGSMKDRMALAMIETARRDGRLPSGGSVVEYTGGSTGVSLAQVAAALGHPLRIVTSDAFSLEKRTHMAALGAELTLIPSPTGGTTRELTLEMIETARVLRERHGSYWTDQFNNRDVLPAYSRLADELLEQAGGTISAFVQMVGTAGSIRGIGTRLRERSASTRIVAVEPAESPLLAGGIGGSHGIEGTGPGFVPPLWDGTPHDAIVGVSTDEAMAMARRLAREEGIFAGTSTGANVVAALAEAERLGPGDRVVTLAIDGGMKYLSTALYRNT